MTFADEVFPNFLRDYDFTFPNFTEIKLSSTHLQHLSICHCRLTEDNSRIKKQYLVMKKSFQEKIKAVESSVAMEKDQKDILQNHANEYQGEVAKVKDAIKVCIHCIVFVFCL